MESQQIRLWEAAAEQRCHTSCVATRAYLGSPKLRMPRSMIAFVRTTMTLPISSSAPRVSADRMTATNSFQTIILGTNELHRYRRQTRFEAAEVLFYPAGYETGNKYPYDRLQLQTAITKRPPLSCHMTAVLTTSAVSSQASGT